MSSQKTEHYELNQWLATDQVLRTDFNADNAKIDAALDDLNAHAGLKLINSWETETAARGIAIPLVTTQWDTWKTVIIDVIPASGTSANINLNYSSPTDTFGRISTKWTRLILCPFGQKTAPLMAVYWGASASLFRNDIMTFQGIGDFALFGDTLSDQIASGTKIIIQGEPV